MRNEERSLMGDLNEGSTDGKYKKLHPNRGGHVSTADDLNRSHLFAGQEGYNFGGEAVVKATPDGRVVR